MRDPHEILGITRAASEEEIKRTFRAKAKLYHPDLHPNDAAIAREFREIVQAYHTCLKRRKEKDQVIQETGKSFSEELRRAAQNPSQTSQANKKPKEPSNREFPEDTVDIPSRPNATRKKSSPQPQAQQTPPASKNSLFSMVRNAIMGSFENMLRQSHAQKNSPVQPKTSSKKRQKKAAKALGADVHYTLDVEFLQARNGTKKMLNLKDGRHVQVRIPPEARQEQILRLKGMGEGGSNMTPGDALISINIVDDTFAERSHNDFFLRLPVTMAEAALGANIYIPGLYQDVMLEIPEGSNSGTSLRLKGKGFKDKKTGQTGDQYVTLEIRMPNYLDKRLVAFLKEWSKDVDEDVRRNLGLHVVESPTKKESET